MKYVFFVIGRLLFFFCHLLVEVASKCLRAMNTGYYSYKLKKAGKGISLYYPTGRIIGAEYITIGDYSSLGKRAVVTAWDNSNSPQIVIGSRVAIGDDCHITAANSIVIGDGTLLGKKVTITDNSHGVLSKSDLLLPPLHRSVYSKGPVLIGERVWIADKVTICANVTIGDGAVIGANSVVTHDIPAYCLAAGVPAVVIKQI